MTIAAFLLLLCLPTYLCNSILSTTDTTKDTILTSGTIYYNAVGIRVSLDEIIPYLNDTTLQKVVQNSLSFGNYASIFTILFDAPKGYPANCTLIQSMNTSNPINCTYDIMNSTFYANLMKFRAKTSYWYSNGFGWDYQNANFSDVSYMNNFLQHSTNIFNTKQG